jgi:hypothetical protein
VPESTECHRLVSPEKTSIVFTFFGVLVSVSVRMAG